MALGTLTSLALGLTAVAGVSGVLEAQESRRDTARNLEKQKIEAKEASALKATKDSTEADILLGSDASDTNLKRKKRTGGTQRSSVLTKAGGLSTANRVGI